MTGNSCDRVEAVLQAARSDRLGGEIGSHLSSCPLCRDALLVEGCLSALAREPQSGPTASAGQVWWRAERRARREDLARAMRPIGVLRWISLAVGAALAILLAGWVSPLVASWTHELIAVGASDIELTTISTAGSLLAVLSALVPFLALALWWSWAYE